MQPRENALNEAINESPSQREGEGGGFMRMYYWKRLLLWKNYPSPNPSQGEGL